MYKGSASIQKIEKRLQRIQHILRYVKLAHWHGMGETNHPIRDNFMKANVVNEQNRCESLIEALNILRFFQRFGDKENHL